MLFTTVAKFGLVGMLNTAGDFVIYNVLTLKRFKLGRIKANLVSTTIAMIFSFFANEHYVFGSAGGNVWLKALGFFAVTAFGIYVLQNLVIQTLTSTWKLIPSLAVRLTHSLSLNRLVSDEFIAKNTVKLVATLVSLTWNFIMYKRFVFAR